MGYRFDTPTAYDDPQVAYDGPYVPRPSRAKAAPHGTPAIGSAQLFSRLKLPAIKKIFLMEITAGLWLRGGILDSGTTYKFQSSLNVVDLEINGVSMHNAGSQGACESTPGTWFAVGGWIYVNPPTSHTIQSDTYQAIVRFYFSDRPRIVANNYYEPRLKAAPNLSMRIEPKFSGVGQIGGGQVTLINNDGYFDTLDDLQWDSGSATLLLAADLPTDPAGQMSSYSTIGTWLIDSTQKTNVDFILTLRELKTALEQQIPFETFDQVKYPGLNVSLVGKVIPMAYGALFGVEPVLIDAATNRFKVAGHSIRSFEGLRLLINDAWVTVNFETTNLAKAEFTIGPEFTGTQTVSVDFTGRKNPDGSLMTNAADIIDDLLGYLGEFNVDAGTLANSRAALTIGQNRFGENVCLCAPCLYIDSPTKALDIVGKINQFVGSFLFVDILGSWRYQVFGPVLGSTTNFVQSTKTQAFTEVDVIDGSFQRLTDNSVIYSRVVAHYAERTAEKWTESVTVERAGNQYAHGGLAPNTLTVDTPFASFNDAKYYAQRLLTTEGEPLVKYQFDVPWNAFFLMPGDRIHLTYTKRGNIDAILEVYEAQYDLIVGSVRLIVGNQRGWKDTFGFWLGSSGPINNVATLINPGSNPPSAATPYPSIIAVSGLSGTITNITVTLSNFSLGASGPQRGIGIMLVGPSGDAVRLLDGSDLGAAALLGINVTFDDAAGSTVPNPIVSGTYQPTNGNGLTFPAPAPIYPAGENGLLTVFSGKSANGNWLLYICNLDTASSGSIGSWSLSITTTGGSTASSVPDWSAAWTASQKAAARQNEGFWLGDDDLANSTDIDSYLVSRWW
jgi:hypothetical protein